MALTSNKPPVWFWVVAVILLLWDLQGIYASIQQFRFGAEAMGPASDYDRALFASLPAWYNWVFAAAVGAAAAGALALLLKSAVARPLFIASLVLVGVQFGYLFATTDIIAAKGVWVTYFPLVIVAIGVFQIWFAGLAIRRGWIA